MELVYKINLEMERTVVGATFMAPVVGSAVLGDIDYGHDGRHECGPYYRAV